MSATARAGAKTQQRFMRTPNRPLALKNLCYTYSMNSWSAERKTIYLGLAFLVIVIFIAVPAFLIFYKTPTCFDGKKNGNETGIDCGGSCQILCSFEGLDPIVLWSRAFRVAGIPSGGGVYSAVAYIQNPNINSDALAAYVFKLYDASNVLIGTRENATIIPKNKVLAIFEPNIDAQSKIPARVTFEFTQKLVWRKNLQISPELVVTQKILSGETNSPRIDATVENKSTESVERIEVVAIVYDDNGNAVAASRTFVDKLDKDQSARVAFTWPLPFPATQKICPDSAITGATGILATNTPMNFATDTLTNFATGTPINFATSTPRFCSSSPSVVEIIPRVIPARW